jgi:hypothetical protein
MDRTRIDTGLRCDPHLVVPRKLRRLRDELRNTASNTSDDRARAIRTAALEHRTEVDERLLRSVKSVRHQRNLFFRELRHLERKITHPG